MLIEFLSRFCRYSTFNAVAALILALQMGVPTSPSQADSIAGQVRVTTGKALPSDVTVRLETAENVVIARQMVGNDGKFAFYGLKENAYQIIATAEGFESAKLPVDMHYLASRYPTVYLVPLGTKRTSPEPTESTTDLAAPKSARKEYEKGHDALEARNLDGARKHLEKAIAEDPCFARALTTLGVVLSLQHDFPSAEDLFKKSIKCDGGFLQAYIQMGILLDVEKKFEEGETILEQGLRVAPQDWQLHFRLGSAHHRLGKYEAAKEEYEKAISLSVDVPSEIHIRLADACLRLKEYDEAYTEMQTYLKIDPNGPLASQTKNLLQRVDGMRKSDDKAVKVQ